MICLGFYTSSKIWRLVASWRLEWINIHKMHSSWQMCVVTNILIFLGLGLQAISKPAAWHRFGSANPEESDDDLSQHFISAVCWKSESPTMLAANSQGTIKVLVLAPWSFNLSVEVVSGGSCHHMASQSVTGVLGFLLFMGPVAGVMVLYMAQYSWIVIIIIITFPQLLLRSGTVCYIVFNDCCGF